jgi:hypothetical protein
LLETHPRLLKVLKGTGQQNDIRAPILARIRDRLMERERGCRESRCPHGDKLRLLHDAPSLNDPAQSTSVLTKDRTESSPHIKNVELASFSGGKENGPKNGPVVLQLVKAHRVSLKRRLAPHHLGFSGLNPVQYCLETVSCRGRLSGVPGVVMPSQ